jgi:periplasmic mercuric ion binding protein
MQKLLALFAFASVIGAPAWAAPQTVTLAVSKMTCAACPITVKKALSRVPGVTDVSVNYEKKWATVVFDDTKTTVTALTRATANAGYPSTPEKGAAQ